MRRTYWIRYNTVTGLKFDKVVCTDKDPRPRWHKVMALNEWKAEHQGYGWMTISHVYTKAEMLANGYDKEVRV